jgi:hypothetical protein
VDSPIPLYAVKSIGRSRLSLVLDTVSATCRRPPALALRAYAYGFHLVDDTTSRRHSAGDLVLVDARKPLNARGEALLSRFADESKTEIHSQLVWQTTIEGDVVSARSLYDEAPLTCPRGDVAVHALLGIEDLV